jgi:seryl-tRNA synthetase
MLDIKRIRENETEVRTGLTNKGADLTLLDQILDLDRQRRAAVTDVEALKSRRNAVSKEIGNLKKKGADTAQVQAEMRAVGDQVAAKDEKVREIDARLDDLVLRIPNVPCAAIPVGPDSSGNRVVRTWGQPREFAFKPKTHVEVGESAGIFDFERAGKISGAGFAMYWGAGARLARALIDFMLDLHTREHGYTEVWPPVLCNAASMTGTGQLPKLKDDMYFINADNYYLAPTAEVPVTNLFRDEILASLPVYLTAYSACFRREAGSAGRETRGLIRVHQFDKVEMVKFVEPEKSYDELESLTANAEDVLQRLGLHYRVLELCTGDISFSAAKCYDLELWAPGQNGWLEVSSCSNFEDFQARRAGIRYRDANGKVRFVHTLNGSGVALPRLVVAIVENGQQEDGSIVLPDAIVPYMGGVSRIVPKVEGKKQKEEH